MQIERDTIVSDIVKIVSTISEDWDFKGPIDVDTRLFGDLNWQSIDMVVLAHDIQARYGMNFPFATFFEKMAARSTPGVTIGEIADFILPRLVARV